MNTFRFIFQNSSVATRVYFRKKTRCLYNQNMSMHQIGRKENNAFLNDLPTVIKSVKEHPAVAEVFNLGDWINKLLKHNLSGGKGARGQTVVMAYESLDNPDNISEESMKQARVLGWCVEMFQSYMVIIDDMMDGASTRRGQPCWYLMPEVGTDCAMNDSVLVYNAMFYLLKKNFGNRENYVDMLDTINETMLHSAFGQFLDLKTSHLAKNKNFKGIFTPERHLTIIKYKTAYYTFDLPIILGSLLTGNKLDGKMRNQVQDLSLHLGALYQIQDDYIDCYSDKSLTGKAGSDIQEGKCSWLAVNALQRCSDAQIIVFNACYGSKEPAHIERIKVLYDQLNLPELYTQVEKKYYDKILLKINALPSENWRNLFRRILCMTYQRKK